MPLPKAPRTSELSLITDQLVQGTVIIPCAQGRKGSITLECKHLFVSRGRCSTERGESKAQSAGEAPGFPEPAGGRECVWLLWDGLGTPTQALNLPLLLYPLAFSGKTSFFLCSHLCGELQLGMGIRAIKTLQTSMDQGQKCWTRKIP